MKDVLKLMRFGVLVVLISASAAFAQTPEVSTLPVDEPLDVGGTILQPGTYILKVIPTLGDRNRVQVTSVDGQTIYATVLTVPHDLEPDEEIPNTRLVFFPAGEGQPRALRTWFPPNTAMEAGHDFVYEESRARQLARLANEPVVTYRGEELQVITPEATMEAYTPPAPTPAPTPAPEPMPAPEPAPAPTPAPQISSAPADTTADIEMPETAGKVPMIALLGLLAFAGAVFVRFVR
jgi:hypothetical protein